jgi:cytochrome c peroxidase
MTPNQQQGWNFCANSDCTNCHTPPCFTNNEFRVIGLRPSSEDLGQGAITGIPDDDGRFKMAPGVKPTFMHNGRLASVSRSMIFYQPTEPHFSENLDPLVPVSIPGTEEAPLIDFLANRPTDPRVASVSFPFDRPTLASETPPRFPVCH